MSKLKIASFTVLLLGGAAKPAVPRLPEVLGVHGIVHLEGLGDQGLVDSIWAGTKGQYRRLELVSVEFNTPIPGLGIESFCHLEGLGDQAWRPAGNGCGTRGESRRLEGIAFRLVGDLAEHYSVKYKVHLQESGDSETYQDGEFAGTRGQYRRVEAVWIKIERK